MVSLKGKLISLRGPEPDDIDCIYLWENDASLWPCGSTRAPLSRHQIWQYIDSYDGDIYSQKQLRLIITDNGSGLAAGTVDLYDFDPRDARANVGIFISADFRRKGFAAEALEMTAAYARETLAMHQLAAWVSVDNMPSVNLFKKAGYRSKACLRSWVKNGHSYSDVLIFQKLFE